MLVGERRVVQAGEGDAEGSAAPRWWRHPAVLIGGLVMVVGLIPMTVALATLRDPQWYPILDRALIELRVRDVGSGNPPLLGPIGRFEGYGLQGSHPGPLMFWLLYPLYWLFGGSAWALQVATVGLNLAGMVAAVWLGYRRGGQVMALGVAVTVGLLARSYGIDKMTTVWNPYVVLFWWLAFLLAIWSVLCDDLVALPMAVFAGSLCLQSHYGYLGLVGVLAVIATVALALPAIRRRDGADPRRRRALVRWGLASGALAGLLWLPPVVEELTTTPGNINVLIYSTVHPDENDRTVFYADGSRGVDDTMAMWLAHLDVTTLASHTKPSAWPAPTGPVLPGLLLLGAWATTTAATWRRLSRSVRRLHVTVSAALAAGLATIHGIAGDTWDYLVLWAWGTSALVAVATVLNLAVLAPRVRAAVARRWPTVPRRLPRSPAVGALTIALVVVGVAFTRDATDVSHPFNERQSALIAGLVPDTVDALDAGHLPGGGDGRYLVLWNDDAWWSGMPGTGFYNELDRHGFDVGVTERHTTVIGGEHRVLDEDDADAAIRLVVGQHLIDRWEDTPEAVRVAYYEHRTEAQIAEYERLEREVKAIFREEGRPDLVRGLDVSLYFTRLRELPPEAGPRVRRMLDIGLPGAVFVTPTDVRPEG